MPISIGVFDHMDSGDASPHELYENRLKLIEAYDAATGSTEVESFGTLKAGGKGLYTGYGKETAGSRHSFRPHRRGPVPVHPTMAPAPANAGTMCVTLRKRRRGRQTCDDQRT